jgi:cell division protein FtsB
MSVIEHLRKNPKRAWLIGASSVVLVVALCLAIALTVQNHNDRELEARIEQSQSELMVTGAQIADIKDHQFGTMGEYIEAYARAGPLLGIYDQKLQQFSDLCNMAQERERKPRLVRMQRWFGRYHPEA